MIDKPKKYAAFKKADKSGRGHEGSVGHSAAGQYAMGAGPRVGGTSKPSTPLRGADKSVVKASRKLVRPGTGGGASKQAKASLRRMR
jgi:hypothetical protein